MFWGNLVDLNKTHLSRKIRSNPKNGKRLKLQGKKRAVWVRRDVGPTGGGKQLVLGRRAVVKKKKREGGNGKGVRGFRPRQKLTKGRSRGGRKTGKKTEVQAGRKTSLAES